MSCAPRFLLLLALSSTACRVVEAPLPEGVGRGLLRADARPSGVRVWQRPSWNVGTRIELIRGDEVRGALDVVAVEDGVYVLDDGAGRQLRRDADLGNLGEWFEGRPTRVLSPVDVRYHWPLWIGKRWECDFVDRARGGQALPMVASYHVEGMDRVEVPAGIYDALRVRRTLRLVLPEDDGVFLSRTQMIWFAPDPGVEVRQLLGETMVELDGFRR